MMNFLRCLAEKKRIRWGQKAEKRTKMPIATGGRKGSSRSNAIEELPTGKYKDDLSTKYKTDNKDQQSTLFFSLS